MVGAQAAIVWTSPLHRRVVLQRHLRGLDEYLAATSVVVDVIGDQYPFAPVLHAMFQHVDFLVLEDDFGLALHVTARADGYSNVVKEIGTNALCHIEVDPRLLLRRGAASAAPFDQLCFGAFSPAIKTVSCGRRLQSAHGR